MSTILQGDNFIVNDEFVIHPQTHMVREQFDVQITETGILENDGVFMASTRDSPYPLDFMWTGDFKNTGNFTLHSEGSFGASIYYIKSLKFRNTGTMILDYVGDGLERHYYSLEAPDWENRGLIEIRNESPILGEYIQGGNYHNLTNTGIIKLQRQKYYIDSVHVLGKGCVYLNDGCEVESFTECTNQNYVLGNNTIFTVHNRYKRSFHISNFGKGKFIEVEYFLPGPDAILYNPESGHLTLTTVDRSTHFFIGKGYDLKLFTIDDSGYRVAYEGEVPPDANDDSDCGVFPYDSPLLVDECESDPISSTYTSTFEREATTYIGIVQVQTDERGLWYTKIHTLEEMFYNTNAESDETVAPEMLTRATKEANSAKTNENPESEKYKEGATTYTTTYVDKAGASRTGKVMVTNSKGKRFSTTIDLGTIESITCITTTNFTECEPETCPGKVIFNNTKTLFIGG
ncbi:uncharacterized protein SPAPADRAFT_50477 [Spathaspora passalidarum NRRL Y-27907]|uniref:Hyphally-regulated cell wall protein N-terminal domain-containing protein n=1 Tax=Spathaspora passalidarum (strain NRRL Y-27907 / 11-Y1) TaxID=619300 RepID=G3AKL5_SPAPN|nr:uncharacterized protein SPAPADRAFT_50477 [Spathaspora passalidarum NRRL Y-27907]EGW33620.1 hypothetical protein SPAPADRAFT_50477 [Spathaspora passalidarum NRRL Y-27907]